jgi:hypothetical protein
MNGWGSRICLLPAVAVRRAVGQCRKTWTRRQRSARRIRAAILPILPTKRSTGRGSGKRLRQLLEAGQLEAAILDPFTGALHQATTSLWRRHDADRLIEKGQAPIPRSSNTGSVLVKRFAESNVDTRPIPQAKIQEAIEALKKKLATESLTRSEQAEFVRQTFSAYRITERQLRKIFRAVPMPTGRPRKSDA